MKGNWAIPVLASILILSVFAATDVFAVDPPSFVLKWGSFGTGDGQFNSANGVATDSSGNVYVAEELNNRIQKFDSSGTFLKMWGYGVEDGTNVFQICTSSCQEGIAGTGDGQFDGSFGVAVDSDDNVYVTGQNNGRIQKFDSSGTFLLKWGSFGPGGGGITSPQGIAVDSTGNVYVADLGNSRIQKFDSSGTFLRMWGYGVEDGTNVFQICTSSCQEAIIGTGDGQFNQPRDVAVDSTGNVYVTDTDNRRIQKFDSSGTFLLKWGSFGTGDGQFTFAIGLATDSSGNVYVADTTNHRIQKFDSSGTFLLKWGSFGTGDGQFNNPLYVTVDSSGNVYVVDSNERVQKFAEPNSSPDATPPVITLVGPNPQTIEVGDPYVELGATALDDVDGDITGSIVIDASAVNTAVLGSYSVTYDVTDLSGNPATQVTRTVNVEDTTLPVITISSVAAPTDGFLASQTVTTFLGTVGTQPTTVTGTVSDNVGVASVDVNGVIATVVSGSWTATGISLNVDTNTITATATDTSTNQAASSVSVNLDLDLDDDDIQNNVDGTFSGQTPVSEVNDTSDNFSDELLGGTTSGNIQQRGDRDWSISDESDDPTTTEIEGLRIIVGPGIETAKVQGSGKCTPMNPVLNFLPSGADIVLTCGSTIVEVNSGGVEITVAVDSLTITVDVGENGSVTLDETDEQTIEISNTGTEPIVLTVNGVSSTVGAGEQQTTTQILIDIKPGSDPNSINPNSNGVIPVAILSTEDFDATAVDVSTITFGPEQVTESHGIGHTEDVNGDDLDDLVLHFKTQDVGITDETELCVSAQTVDEVIIVGCDTINLVSGNNSNNGKGPKNK